MYRVNKQKCLGIDNCGLCQNNCPGATEKGKDGKAKIIDQEKLEECGGKSVCPMGAIEKVNGSGKGETQSQTQKSPSGLDQGRRAGSGRGKGLGKGRGLGKGKGRGLGIGPRDGRGKGRGGGGRK